MRRECLCSRAMAALLLTKIPKTDLTVGFSEYLV